MNTKLQHSITLLIAALPLLSTFVIPRSSRAAERPNILVILADDLGYGDVQCNNPERGKIPKPHIDKLASRGMYPIEKSGEVIRRWDEEHSRVVKLGQKIGKLDEDYLRDSGTMIYITKNARAGNKVINVMRTTIQRPASPKSH